jgi:hypothetical protein
MKPGGRKRPGGWRVVGAADSVSCSVPSPLGLPGPTQMIFEAIIG